MAIGTITGAEFPMDASYCGPVESGGNLYVVMKSASDPDSIVLFESSNGGFNWTAAASQTLWANAEVVRSLAVEQVGSTLHVAVQGYEDNGDGTFSHPISYVQFDLAAGTSGGEVSVEAISSDDASSSVAITVRSDGDILIFGNGPDEDVNGTLHSRVYFWESTDGGVSFSVGTMVSQAGDTTGARSAVVGTDNNDLTQIMWQSGSSLDHRTMNPDSTMNSLSVDIATAGTSSPSPATPMRYDGGLWHVVYRGLDTSDFSSSEWGELIFLPLTDPSFTDTPDISLYASNSDHHGALAVDDGNTVHLIYVRGTDNDLFYTSKDEGSEWDSDVDLVLNVTSDYVNANAVAGTIGFIYDDSGTVLYDQLASAAVPIGLFEGSRMVVNPDGSRGIYDAKVLP